MLSLFFLFFISVSPMQINKLNIAEFDKTEGDNFQ
jgi:hypothetical protein